MRRLAEAELRDSTERSFEAYGEPLENMMAFKYLGKVMTAGDGDWPAVVGNLRKARKSWGRLSLILHQHVLDTVVILEEGNLTHPQCLQCNMLVTWRKMNGRHLATAQYARGAEQNMRQLA